MTVHSIPAAEGELLAFPGSLMIVRTAAKSGGDRLSVIENRMPFGDSPPLHIHRNEDEVFHILEGSLRFAVGGEERVAHAGETLLAPKRVPHTYRVISPQGARVLVVTSGGDFEAMVRAASVPAASPDVPTPGPLTPDQIGAIVEACSRHGIDIVGPPLG